MVPDAPADPSDSAPADVEPTPAPSDEAQAPEQHDAGDVTGSEPSAGVEQAEVSHVEPTDPDAVGGFTAPPDGAPELVVDDDEDGGDTDG